MNMRMRVVTVAALTALGIASLGICGAAGAQQRAVTLDDFAKIVAISGPAISHDGRVSLR